MRDSTARPLPEPEKRKKDLKAQTAHGCVRRIAQKQLRGDNGWDPARWVGLSDRTNIPWQGPSWPSSARQSGAAKASGMRAAALTGPEGGGEAHQLLAM